MASTSGSAKIARRYARALALLCDERGDAAAVRASLTQIVQTLEGTPEALAFLTNPTLPHEPRTALLATLLKELGVTGTAEAFTKLVLDNGRIGSLAATLAEFAAIQDARSGRADATLTSAVPLDAAAIARMAAAIKRLIGKEVQVTASVDPELLGGVVVRVPLRPDSFRPDFALIAAAITPRTRALIINSPHNPTATVWTLAEMQQLADLLRGTDLLLISDEVYEHMVFDGAAHQSVARFPELAARSFIVSSFGKTYHVTGWKIGYVAAPASLTHEFRKVHQFNVFTVNTPMQHGLAAFMADPKPYLELPAFYQRSRDLFRAGLANSKFDLLPCEGTYFQCVDYGRISNLGDQEFCTWLTREVGVAAIPVSAFYDAGCSRSVVRFCFAKRDETLLKALALLQQL